MDDAREADRVLGLPVGEQRIRQDNERMGDFSVMNRNVIRKCVKDFFLNTYNLSLFISAIRLT